MDNNTLVYFEPSLTDMFTNNGYKDTPGGVAYRSKEVYSYHVYCGVVYPSGEPLSRSLCDVLDKDALE